MGLKMTGGKGKVRIKQLSIKTFGSIIYFGLLHTPERNECLEEKRIDN